MKNCLSVLAAALLMFVASQSVAVAQQLPPVPVPPENPITEPKRVLGKILFFDEQMSTDNTMACATCHQPAAGGGDPRRQRTVGPDGVLGTGDDIFGSPAVVRSDELLNYVRDTVRGTQVQVTGRASNPTIDAAYFDSLFWDGRAGGRFVDPQTGEVAIASGGALESQAMGPPESAIEMGHVGRDWNQIIRKLVVAKPLALATNLTADVQAALAERPTYPMLFEAAFGDSAMTSMRIAFAIATYQRTLIANATPFDRYMNNEPAAMTANQITGWNAFNTANCNSCHTPPTFSNNNFHNIGLRPAGEDIGRQAVTGDPADIGKFKTSGLRNMSLRSSFMHNGQMLTILDVVRFYNRSSATFPVFTEHLDPLMDLVSVPGPRQGPMVDFLLNALTDPRVRDGVFPFDAMTLYSQRTSERPAQVGTGVAGAGGVVPQWIATMPPLVGSGDFRLGLDRARGGAAAMLVSSLLPPVGGRVAADRVWVNLQTTGEPGAAGAGLATAFVPIAADRNLVGTAEYFQWIITDASAVGGYSQTAPLRVSYICGAVGCAPVCMVDIASPTGAPGGDGVVTGGDFLAFVIGFSDGLAIADIAGPGGAAVPDGIVDGEDFVAFINMFVAGC